MAFTIYFRSLGVIFIALAFIYYTLAAMLNRIKVTVTKDHLDVNIGPVPWMGDFTLKRDEVLQLYGDIDRRSMNDRKYIVQRFLENRNFQVRRIKSISEYEKGHFELVASMIKGKKKSVLRWLPTANYPIYLEQRIESFWEIEDDPLKWQLR